MGYKYYEGNWSDQRAMAKLQWDRLSYAELEQTRGNFEELADLIQERYGVDQEEAMAQVEDFFSRY
ncbi:general stress protein CsbD [Arsukibacterium ikkense]|uniref:General stress protein CsbD n=1 Tax=Arsukibacterium ikkense TaxID=336831 RepID=A0A0M2V530_9GAMM|nr:general stress protein CsbD [Arsukibacterium ikkense]KKO45741.1 general stress protein CsbD [Arsukibacterium ikkense]